MTWDFASNPFETFTRRRFAAMDSLLADHVARCASQMAQSPRDPDVSIIYRRAMEARTAWNVAYLKWTVSRRTHKGRTFAVNQLVAELRGRQIGLWQIMVQKTDLENRTWLKDSPAFTALFPHGRRPFQQGGIDVRLAAIVNLSAALAGTTSLTEVHHAVSLFHTSLTTARMLQQEVHATMTQASAALEMQRKSAAETLYRNMARLMEKYAGTPDAIWNFFDRRLLAKAPAKQRS
jgi:hypothetical protein